MELTLGGEREASKIHLKIMWWHFVSGRVRVNIMVVWWPNK